jgi:Na+/melibiose symporter-like transporter
MRDGDKSDYANMKDLPDNKQAARPSEALSQAPAEPAPQPPAEKLTLRVALQIAASAIGELPSKFLSACREAVTFFRNINVPLTPEQLPSYQIGNIQYDKKGLVRLFFWMLFATVFVMTFFEGGIWPVTQYWNNEFNFRPRTWGYFGAASTVIGFILGPVISTASDRHRGPRGRRIPFMAFAAPFVGIALIILAFSRDIGGWIYPTVHLHFPSVTDEEVRVATISTLGLCFGVVNMFMGTVGNYLLNDVVPRAFITRFVAYSAMAGLVVGVVFNVLIYPYTNSMDPKRGAGTVDFVFFRWHGVWGQLILVGGAIFGMIAYTTACLKIKEPSYPPPPKHMGDKPGLVSTVETYCRECYSHKFYLMLFLAGAASNISDGVSGYQNLLWLDIGMDTKTIGFLNNISSVATFCLLGIVAGLSAKINPVRLYLYAIIGLVATCPIGFLYLIPGLSYNTYFGVRLVYLLTHIPINIIMSLAGPIMTMTLLPRSRYGQFCAAGGMITTVLGFGFGKLVANNIFMEGLKQLQGQYYLRYVHVWSFFWLVLQLLIYCWIYREWKRMGAEKYTPPRTWRTDDPPPMTIAAKVPALATGREIKK